MPLDTAQQVRLRIQDQPLRADETFFADGSASAFQLPHRNVQSGTGFVFVSAGGVPVTGWSATGVDFDASGLVTFSAVPSAESALRAVYVHSTFSDDEIGHFTAVGGSVVGASLEAVQALMFDSLKRARWGAADGSQYDDTKAMDQLRYMHSALKEEVNEGEVAAGGFQNWSLEQENFN